MDAVVMLCGACRSLLPKAFRPLNPSAFFADGSRARGGLAVGGARLLPCRASTVAVEPFVRDSAATALITVGAYSLVLAFDKLTERKIVEQNLSRKIVHVLSGVLFMSSWPLFSSSPEARYFAAVTPLVNCIRLLCYGLQIFKDEAVVKSVTREGKSRELLRGPLYYVLVLLFSTLFFWRDSPVGVISLSMMCGGDGFADIVGRRYGASKLPYNRKKSWMGSISMFIAGLLLSAGMMLYFARFGYMSFRWRETFSKLVLIVVVATLVESLPVSDCLDDNISVPLASMMSAMLVFGFHE